MSLDATGGATHAGGGGPADPGWEGAQVDAVTALRRWSIDVARIRRVSSLVLWDRATAAPKPARPELNQQYSLLRRVERQTLLRDDIAAALDSAAGIANPTAEVAWLVAQARRYRERALLIPAELGDRLAEAISDCRAALLQARAEKGQLRTYLTQLQHVFDIKREEAEGMMTGPDFYDACLQEWEQGLTLSVVRGAPARHAIDADSRVPLGVDRQDPTPELIWTRHFLQDAPRLAHLVGVDTDKLTIARGDHTGATTVGPADIRLSVREQSGATEEVIRLMHEFGHVLLEQHADASFAEAIFPEAPSAVVHEAIARFLEVHVAGEVAFWRMLKGALEEPLPSPDALSDAARKAAETISSGLSSIAAARERFELELGVFEGTWRTIDLPDIWDAKHGGGSRDALLSDSHWSYGMLGYYPCYLLAAQLSNELKRDFETEFGALGRSLDEHGFCLVSRFLKRRVLRHAPIAFARTVSRVLWAPEEASGDREEPPGP